jgi:dTMP kinase
MKGMFICFEGGEGAGKTSQISVALEVIDAMTGRETLRTREPGGTVNAEAIRSILIAENADHDSITNTLLFAAARREHVERLIRPKLEQGTTVITDRFVLSTLAYQGAEGVDQEFIRRLHEDTTGGLMPDLTIILDVDPRIGIARSRDRLAASGSNESRFEGYDLEFHDRMRAIMLSYDLSPRIVIDASRPQEDVERDIRSAIAAFVAEHLGIERDGPQV